jgi:hypothetical protein
MSSGSDGAGATRELIGLKRPRRPVDTERMRSRLRENAVAIVSAALAIWIVGRLTLYGWALTDYDFEARPALDALLGGHVLLFLHLAPVYGGSLIMRSPFVFATKLWNGGELSIYRAAAAPCLAAAAIFGVWLVSRMRAQGHTRLARALALGLCVANPLSLQGLELGHPEELLGAVLCVAAVIAALRGRAAWAGVLLGLAIANKEWALLAVGPVLIALPQARTRALLVATGVSGALVAPLLLAGTFLGQVRGAATQATVIFNPWQVWWFLGGHAHVLRVGGHIVVGHRWNHRVEPTWLASVSHPLIIATMVPLTLLYAYRRRNQNLRPASDVLLLLAMLMLLRCMLDPWNMEYYLLPFALALLAWEIHAHQRPPALSLGTALAAWLVFEWVVPSRGFSPDMQSLVFLAWALPTLIAIACALYAPGLGSRLRARVSGPLTVPRPASAEA